MTVTDETRARMSTAHQGKRHSPETREKLSAAALLQHSVAKHPCHGMTRDQRDLFDEIASGVTRSKRVNGPTERALVARGLITVAADSVPKYSVTTAARQQWLRWRGRVKR